MDVQQATQVIETDPNSYITSDPSYLLANQEATSPSAGQHRIMGYLLMPQSCPIQLLFDSRNGITTHVLATTAAQRSPI